MWDLNDLNAPESEAVQSEREIVEDLVRTEAEPTHYTIPAQAIIDAAEKDECDRCGKVRELFHNEATGLSLCDACDRITNEVEALVPPAQPLGEVRFKRLRNNAWGIIGPSALLREGVDVAVTKRDGTATMATVSRVIWTGDGKAICSIRRA